MNTFRTSTRMAIVVFGLLGVCSIAEAKVVYVATTGSDDNDGLSWPTAKRTVQAGLNTAQPDDQVWVAAGTYVECITLTSGVALYGGFKGDEITLAQRNWTANRTILDGNAVDTVVFMPWEASSGTRIDGFTIRNGVTQGLGGGGISCVRGSPTIVNNTITGNFGLEGGGISCVYSASPTIANNVIIRNSASYGGGIECSDQSSPTITNNTITANSADYGGGIDCFDGSSPTIVNTIIAFNSSGINCDQAAPTLRFNCVFGNADYNYYGLIDPTGTEGNISADPKLAGPTCGGNVHIQPDSPCVDAGDDGAVQSGWTDIDGQSRIIGAHVDIGADELSPYDGPFAIVRVSPAGNDANDGSSWASAKRTVQAAMDAASLQGGEVWVKAGVYLERTTLRPCVHVYGGFGGTETQRQQRDWRVFASILDGQAEGSVVTIGKSDDASTTIDGFTIRNGKGEGAGVNCRSSSLVIANNTITGNIALGGSGAICRTSSLSTILNNTITANSGNGIVCGDSATVANNTVTANSGSGIVCGNSATVVNNAVTANSGCGIVCDNSATVVNNTVTTNSGCGIVCGDSATVTNTIIAFNSSGVQCTGNSLSLRSNCVYGNTSYNYAGVTDPAGANGNISDDPRLASVLHGNAHLQPSSPCVDAGDDGAVQSGWTDMDGQSRIIGSHVDIGADESDGTIWQEGPYAIVRVSPRGDDANDGSSWASAKRTVQAAIDTASIAGGEVWVETGIYLERISLRPYTYLYGGFAGEETQRQQRDWRAHSTILDGQAGGSTVTAAQAGHLLSTIDGFIIRNGMAPKGAGICSLTSLTIMNNTITGNSAEDGGGIYCGSSSMIANNTITGNSASYTGGGVYCYYSASPTITNNTIVANCAVANGGGVFCESSSSPTITNTVIAFNSSGVYSKQSTRSLRFNCAYGNTAYDYGGLMDPTGTDGNISADPKLASLSYGNVHIQPDSPCIDAGDDTAARSGWTDIDGQARIAGAHIDIGADESDDTAWPAGPYVIARVSPKGNDANDGSSWASAKRTVQAAIVAASTPGGEVWVKAGTYQERLILLPCVHLYGGFGGMETRRQQRDWHTNLTVLNGQAGNPVVMANQAGHLVGRIDGFTIRGGEGSYGGGICCAASSLTIANNTITANAAHAGGGIGCGPSSIIVNNTLTGNSAYNGGGIYCNHWSSPTIVNNTITGNNAMGQGGGVYWDTYSSPIIANTLIAYNSSGVYGYGEALSLRSNCVCANAQYNYSGSPVLPDPTGTNGNISTAPKLAGVPYGKVHLQPDSPCVDAGDDNLVQSDWTDVDGQMRIAGSHVDIGSDESDGTIWPEGPNVIVRVSPEGKDSNDGSSWALSKQSVKNAVNAASTLGGDVWVKAGIYSGDCVLQPYVHVYGGFDGTETHRYQRDWSTHVSVLSGSSVGSTVKSYHSGYLVSTIDGFTIRNGGGTPVTFATWGGGIYCSSSSPMIANNTITSNNGAYYGGGIACEYSSSTITNNTIVGNSASYGGGIYCHFSLVTIANNTIVRNSGLHGGGLYSATSDGMVVTGNMISGNSANDGGGIYCSSSSPTITNNTLTGNGAYRGGGICCISSSPRITNNTIAKNGKPACEGGGVYCRDSSPIIANTIISGNFSGFFKTGARTQTILRNCAFGNTMYDYSGLTNPTGTNGNISADPRLVRPPSPGADGQWGTTDDDLGNLRLTSGSPCIDAGDNWAVPAGILTDLAGLARFFDDPATPDTGLGIAPVVDMGAYEYHTPAAGDFDLDGDVDADDLNTFLPCLSGPTISYADGCAMADLDGDEDVDQSDFGLLQRCFSGADTPPDCGG